MSDAKQRDKEKNTKRIVLLAVLVLSLVLAVGTTLAYLYAQTDSVVNIFEPVDVSCEVKEDFDGEIKKTVKIENTGEIDAYIRAAVVVTWIRNRDGSIAAEAPVADTDYRMAYAENTGWVEGGDGFWYYQKPIAPGEATGVFMVSCIQNKEKEGYSLSVEIIASAIQSTPESAVQEVWNVTVDENGNIGKGA